MGQPQLQQHGHRVFLPDGSISTFGSPTANNQVNFTNGIDPNGETRQIFWRPEPGATTLISGDVVDIFRRSTVAVTKTGEGTLIVSGINSYGGGTILENGTLIFGERRGDLRRDELDRRSRRAAISSIRLLPCTSHFTAGSRSAAGRVRA